MQPGVKRGRPRSKAKYAQRPIVDQYREGTVKSTPARGVKENLKPCAYTQSEPLNEVTACLLEYDPASCPLWPG